MAERPMHEVLRDAAEILRFYGDRAAARTYVTDETLTAARGLASQVVALREREQTKSAEDLARKEAMWARQTGGVIEP